MPPPTRCCVVAARTDLDRVLIGGTVRVRGLEGDWLELRLDQRAPIPFPSLSAATA